jgi:hypothetical protein
LGERSDRAGTAAPLQEGEVTERRHTENVIKMSPVPW